MYQLEENYESVPRTEQTPVSPWKKFFVHLAGRTDGAHTDFIQVLKHAKQSEASSFEESDYVVVFCPVVSRVQMDISKALEGVPAGKPTILVVMHHTSDQELAVAESRLHVTDPAVRLTVDCLFYHGKLLRCYCNKVAWVQVLRLIAETQSVSKKRLMLIVIMIVLLLIVVLATVTAFVVN